MARAEAELHNTVFTKARAQLEEWEEYIGGLNDDELMRVGQSLDKWIEEIDKASEALEVARQSLEYYVKRRAGRVEKDRRVARTASTRISLRGFLSAPPLGTDLTFEQLQLCSKTGASMRLEELSFLIEGGREAVRSINAAKEYFQKGHACKANWHLYYVREGRRSSGFAWDRPFLDEVFVLLS